MQRSKLRNNFLLNRSNENRKKYLKQRNYSVSLSRRIQRTITGILMRIILLIKSFGKRLPHFFRTKFHQPKE